MRADLRRLASWSAAALLASPAWAQPALPAAPACEPARVFAMTPAEIASGPLGVHHPRLLLDSLAPALGRGAWAEAMAAAIGNAGAALAAGGVPSADAARVTRALREVDDQFTILLDLPYAEQGRQMALAVRPARFQLDEGADGSVTLLADTTGEIVVGRDRPLAERRALCWPAMTLHQLLTVHGARRRAETVQRLDALAARWDSYVRNSYSQLPWELAVNGWGRPRTSLEPPRRQLVLFHPSVGVEANGTVLRELRRVDVAVLEALGLIFHYNDDYSRYLGLSAVATFAADRDVAVGAYAHLWFPQAKLGWLRRSDPDARRRSSVLVSVDVYDLLSGVPDRIRAARERALGRALVDVGGTTR